MSEIHHVPARLLRRANISLVFSALSSHRSGNTQRALYFVFWLPCRYVRISTGSLCCANGPTWRHCSIYDKCLAIVLRGPWTTVGRAAIIATTVRHKARGKQLCWYFTMLIQLLCSCGCLSPHLILPCPANVRLLFSLSKELCTSI